MRCLSRLLRNLPQHYRSLSNTPLSAEDLLLRATNGDISYTARDLIQAGSRSDRASLIPHTATQAVCDAYRAYDNDHQRTEFLVTLARDMNLNHDATTEAISKASQLNTTKDTPERIRRVTTHLRKTLTPAYETLFSRMLAQVPDGMEFLVDLRADLLRNIRHLSKPKNKEQDKDQDQDKEITIETIRYLKDLDANLKQNMTEWFSMSFLRLERVTMDMPGHVLDKIVQGEKVHPIESFDSLRQRLGDGRRCYAFFHPSLPRIPLAFVHVALLSGIADRMDVITGDDASSAHENKADSAIFYSISSTQAGLSGVDLGNFLIKNVAKDIQKELPNVCHYSTLSPVPGLTGWMKRRGVQLLREGNISNVDTTAGQRVANLLEEKKHNVRARDLDVEDCTIVGQAAAHYLYNEKLRGRIMCPVGNFHVRNGAEAWRLNVHGGDHTERGALSSYGIMVNYKYNLDQVEENNERYVLSGDVKIGDGFDEWL